MNAPATPTDPSPAPVLAPPGAGLPAYELFIARRLFAARCLVTSRTAAVALIATERAAIDALVRPCDPALAAPRVLIPRPRGLEDSSRHWSVWMTLEHLRLVNEGVAATIRELVTGRVPPGVASPANVKPTPSVDARVLAAFDASCETLARAGREAASLRTPVRYVHPWFGPLDAARWQVLGGMHLGLHRRQIETILATLGAPR
ncbi:MAG: DinB family protein [Verrucomicrobia bacterium]|nr:DinB family protein [Verrucomicrobiota bacterium]